MRATKSTPNPSRASGPKAWQEDPIRAMVEFTMPRLLAFRGRWRAMPPSERDARRDYWASLPERAVRAAAAGVGGLAYETSEVALPPFVRHSKLYQATVARLLRIVVELIGGVAGVFGMDSTPVRELAVRKLAGNALELAGFVAFGLSPVWLLAAAADLTNGTRTYLMALVHELKRTNLLPEEAEITSVQQLLDTLEQTAGKAAETIDVPPLNVADMRHSLHQLQQNVQALPSSETLAALYSELRAVSQEEDRSLLFVSSALAAGAIQAGVQVSTTHIFDYYRAALGAVHREGFPRYLQRIARPYAEAAARHLDPQQSTFTQRGLLWWRGRRPTPTPPAVSALPAPPPGEADSTSGQPRQ